MPVLNPTALINNRCEAIQRYHVEAGLHRAEIDVSGGIDSAVMLVLLAETLGPENVTAVYSRINSSPESGRRARLVAEVAGVRLAQVHATGAYNVLVDSCLQALREAGYDMEEIDARVEADPAVMGSLRSTLRAPLGRFMNRLTGGGLRHGTGNECEDRWLRFYQKGGDGEVDTNPLAMLSKGEVYQLGNALHVPREILEALPTPDLWGTGEAHNDEEELTRTSGVEWTYSRIDVDTNRYVRVGTIERMSRLLDEPLGETLRKAMNDLMDQPLYNHLEVPAGATFESVLFPEDMSPIPCKEQVQAVATQFGLTLDHLVSARKWERSTRHKMNPNCPSLGRRQRLVEDGVLTNELPEV